MLAKWVVNADLAEQAFHAEGTGFVHENRHHALAQGLIAQKLRDETHIGLRGGDFAAFGGGLHDGLEHIQRWYGKALIGLGAAMRQIATERFAPLVQILHLRRVVSRLVERQFCDLAIWNRNIKTITEGFDVFVSELLGLVNGIFAFTNFAHAKTFHGFDQEHRRLIFVLHGCVKCGKHFLWIVAAAL